MYSSCRMLTVVTTTCLLAVVFQHLPSQERPVIATKSQVKWVIGQTHLIEEGRAKEFESVFSQSSTSLPKVSDVVSIYGEINAIPNLDLPPFRDGAPMFEMPNAYHRLIYDQIEQHKIDTGPAFYIPEGGCLKIYGRDGRMIRVCWYHGGPMKGGDLYLSIQGIRFVVRKDRGDVNDPDLTDTGAVFDHLIREAYADFKK